MTLVTKSSPRLSKVIPESSPEDLARQALVTARVQLLLGREAQTVFFATLALRLTLQVDPTCETMATDGNLLLYAPEFVLQLSRPELLGVLVHEVMHNALGHHWRRGQRPSVRWNIACDLAINHLLLSAGFTLPASRLCPGVPPFQHFPTGLCAEEYDHLLSEQAAEPTENRQDPGGCGEVRDPSDPKEFHAQQAKWQVALSQAQELAARCGTLPAGLVRVATLALQQPLDWRVELGDLFDTWARHDYSWTRPNRRWISQGLYLPSLHSWEMGELALAVDVSGSITPAELGRYTREIEAVLQALGCSVWVLYHDTRLQKVEHYSAGEQAFTFSSVGGGGTSHVPVFAWLDEAPQAFSGVVCLTDLETRFPHTPPSVPVVWAVTGCNSVSPPFGRVLRLS